MKSFKLALIVVVVVSLAASAGTVQASRMLLSLSSTSPSAEVSTSTNPTLTLTPGGTGSLYVWWQPTTSACDYGGNEQLSGWGHNIVESNTLLSSTAYSIANPHIGAPANANRWGSTSSLSETSSG